MSNADKEILTRAAAVLEAAHFGRISRATAMEYRSVAERIQAARAAAGAAWRGVRDVARTPGYAAVCRAAWARRTHLEVAAALRELRDRRISAAEALARLRSWVPEAEACRPAPPRAADGLRRGAAPSRPRPSRSKRARLKMLPPDWMSRLWLTAVGREARHLDALAVLLATGCRPAEVCSGVAVRQGSGGVEICIAGAKVRKDESVGQPWRRLTVALDAAGPVAHLAALAVAAPGGVAYVAATCSPNALSMGVADLAADCLPGQRISAYDIRHQRAADARIAFSGDLGRVADWLGHTSLGTVRFYARLPRSSGVRGAVPLAAAAPLPIRRRALRSPAPAATPAAP